MLHKFNLHGDIKQLDTLSLVIKQACGTDLIENMVTAGTC